MTRKLFVSIPEYWEMAPRRRPRTFNGLMKRVQRKGGFWRVAQENSETGEIVEQWLENQITDNGALSLFKNLMNGTSAGIAVANIIAIDASLGFATVGVGGIASGGTVTSVPIGSLTGPTIPSGTTLVINAGQSTTLTVTTTAAITSASTSVTVSSVSGPASAIPAGAGIRYAYSSVPSTDAASLTSASYTSALPNGQFAFSGTGVGNRQMQVTTNTAYNFSTTGTPAATAGAYTSAWLVNANPVASTANTFVHLVFDTLQTVGTNQNVQVTIIEKL